LTGIISPHLFISKTEHNRGIVVMHNMELYKHREGPYPSRALFLISPHQAA